MPGQPKILKFDRHRSTKLHLTRFLILFGIIAAIVHPFFSLLFPNWKKELGTRSFQQLQPVNYQGDTPHCTPPQFDKPGLLEYGCKIVQKACLDEGKVNLHGLKPDEITKWPFGDMGTLEQIIPGYEEEAVAVEYPGILGTLYLQTPVFRRVSPLDRFDNIDPVFSNCTVPLLFGVPYFTSYADIFISGFQSLYILQQELHLIDDNLLLTPLTANYRLPPHFYNLMRVLTKKKIVGFEEFSSRQNIFDPERPRCFNQMLICPLKALFYDFPKPKYPVNDSIVYPGVQFTFDRDREWRWLRAGAAGEFLVEQYRNENLVPTVEKDPETLDITIAVRNGNKLCRNFLEIDQFVEDCNMWRPPPTNRWKVRKVRCTTHVFGVDFSQDLALMQKSDVLLGHHGAELANSWFMKQGSSAIEVRMKGFDGVWPDRYYRHTMRSEDYIFYWQAQVVSEELWEPCVFERNKTGLRHELRDRHTILRFEDFEPIFVEILRVNRNREEYVKLDYNDVRWEI